MSILRIRTYQMQLRREVLALPIGIVEAFDLETRKVSVGVINRGYG
jgi:hypothetical protein